MQITQNQEGYIIINDIINGFMITKKYLYYTKQEAIKAFKAEYQAK